MADVGTFSIENSLTVTYLNLCGFGCGQCGSHSIWIADVDAEYVLVLALLLWVVQS